MGSKTNILHNIYIIKLSGSKPNKNFGNYPEVREGEFIVKMGWTNSISNRVSQYHAAYDSVELMGSYCIKNGQKWEQSIHRSIESLSGREYYSVDKLELLIEECEAAHEEGSTMRERQCYQAAARKMHDSILPGTCMKPSDIKKYIRNLVKKYGGVYNQSGNMDELYATVWKMSGLKFTKTSRGLIKVL